ncbi:MAG: NADH-quinone oxidoreductase subunit N [Myxococcota bacterium]
MQELLTNILSLIFLFLSSLLLLIILSFKRRESGSGFINTLSVISLIIGLFWESYRIYSSGGEYLGHMITVNNLTSISTIILYITGIFSIIITDSFRGFLTEDRGDSAILTLFGLCGMQLMIISSEFILMLIGLEIASMSLFVLSARNHRSRLAIEGTIKYLIFSSVFFAISLLGVALLYGYMLSVGLTSDMLSFHNLGFAGRSINAGNVLFIIMYIFIVALILLKLGIVPFHMWMPDFYEGSASCVSGFASTSIKVASTILLVNIFSKLFFMPLVADYHIAFKFLELLTIITIIVATVIALHQTNAKRLIAYSSIANAAIIMLGILSFTVMQKEMRGAILSNVLFFLLIYSIMNLLAFGIISRLEKAGGENQLLTNFSGLYYKSPFLAIALSVALFSLAGLPPTGGFFAKLFIFKSAIDSGLIQTSVIAILMTIISLYYYLNFVVIMFLKEPVGEKRYEGSISFNISTSLMLFILIITGFFPNILTNLISELIGK